MLHTTNLLNHRFLVFDSPELVTTVLSGVTVEDFHPFLGDLLCITVAVGVDPPLHQVTVFSVLYTDCDTVQSHLHVHLLLLLIFSPINREQHFLPTPVFPAVYCFQNRLQLVNPFQQKR